MSRKAAPPDIGTEGRVQALQARVGVLESNVAAMQQGMVEMARQIGALGQQPPRRYYGLGTAAVPQTATITTEPREASDGTKQSKPRQRSRSGGQQSRAKRRPR